MIHPTARIHPSVKVGEDVYIGPYCIIGYPAEVKDTWGKQSNASVVIGDRTVITGACTIDAGTNSNTVIGEDCFIMKQTHIGHDAQIGNNVIISPHATIGGHCILEDQVNFGMNSVIHQRAKAPKGCMVGMGAVITKTTNMIAGYIYIGNPAHIHKPNPKYNEDNSL